MFTEIKTALINISTRSNLFSNVLNYEPSSLESFPTACITADSHESNNLAFSTIGNLKRKKTFRFNLRVYYGLGSIDGSNNDEERQRAEQKMCEIADNVINLIEQNQKLDNTCTYSHPLSSKFGETEREKLVKYINFIIEAET